MNARQIFTRSIVILVLGLLLAGAGGTTAPGQAEAIVSGTVTAATVRVSVAADGTQGNDDSRPPAALSADGRFVVFDSHASNLVSGDGNGINDIFVHDRDADGDGILDEPGAISASLVSVSTSGVQANDSGAWYDAVISADGRYVAFTSNANNLVVGDNNGRWDVFLRDRDVDADGIFDEPGAVSTTRVSVPAYGELPIAGYGGGSNASLSADGRYVAFDSGAADLVGIDLDGDSICDTECDTNAENDIFVRDRLAGHTSLVSLSSGGGQGNGQSGWPAISADGRYVAFESWSTNLVGDDTNATVDIFVHDRVTGQTIRASVSSSGEQGNGNSTGRPSISSDGRYVAFHSWASNLVSDDTNGGQDVFVYDQQTGQTTRVSVKSNGAQGTGGRAWKPSLSPDGRYVAFESAATNLVSGDTNWMDDIFVHDRDADGDGIFDEPGAISTTRVSVASNGDQSSGGGSEWPAISADACFVSFGSTATNLVSDDTNAREDIFVRAYGQFITAIVNSIGDAPDANPADGVCDTGAGECTLRAAIQTTNQGCAGVIRFDIPGSGSSFPTIQLQSPLPDVTRPVQIDGNWQPQGMVELDGSNAGAGADGLHITAGSSLVQGLIINRFSGNGIHLSGGGGNTLRGNYLGVDQTGSLRAGNTLYGIGIENSANNIVGGSGELQRNLISANGLAGVMIWGSASTGNRVQNSYIGVNKFGNANLFNEGPGVSIEEASSNTIGGTTAGQRNVISGNKQGGVTISGSGATGNKVQGNYIGVQANGAGRMANTGPGVRIVSGNNNQVGGMESGAGNVIAFNTGEGVLVEWGEGNAILSNSIHSNEKLGIDLWGDGITANDPGDGDAGPNSQQNFPTFTEMYVNAGKLNITGGISSTATTTFRLEFFSNDSIGSGGDVQGRDFRATINVTTDGEGYAEFTVQLPDVGLAHTAAATRLDASGQPLHTSEFTPIDIDIIAVEVTQAIQDTSNSIPLVALKPTYVRVHVRALGAAEIPNIQAQLTGYRGETQLGTIYSQPAAINVVRFPRRQLASSGFFFPLPRDWILQTGELTVEAEVNFEPRQKQEAAYSNNKKSVTATIENEPWLRMRLCDVMITSITGLVRDAPEAGTAAGIESMVTAMYPIPVLHAEYCALYRNYVGPGDMLATLQVNKDLTEMRTWDRLWGEVDADVVYYGIIPGVSRGQADPINPVASSGDGDEETTDRWVYETGAHELGHVFGRWHTCSPEGGEWYCDSDYPHADGAISSPPSGAPFSEFLEWVFYGFDSTSSNPIHMDNAIDIMSYNPGGRWISDYTYLSLMDYRNQALAANASQPALQPPGDYLMATGLISLTQQTATITSLYRLSDVVSQTLPAPGDFDLRLLDSGGATLADYPFAAAASIPPEEGEPVAIFSILAPYLDGTTQVQVISGTQVLATRLASSHAPTITLTAPLGGEIVSGTLPISWTASDEDGDDLLFVIFYSSDDGLTWNMQATSWPSATLVLDANTLSGSQQARLRLLVSDGFHTAQATSAAFTVSPHAPEPFILLPEENAHFDAGALAALQGSAYDREDGSLSGTALAWTSSLDGTIGSDTMLYLTNLSLGWHTITLTATDGDGMSASVSVTIRVGQLIFLPLVMR